MNLFDWITLLIMLAAGAAWLLLMVFILKGLKKPYIPVPPKATDEPDAFVSVVVAARNEETSLPALLQSLSMQDYPRAHFELILVDDGSDDRTADLMRAFAAKTENPETRILKIPPQDAGSKKNALFEGIRNARGELILTTDGDCRMESQWMQAMVRPFAEEKVQLVLGPVGLIQEPGWFRGMQALEFLSLTATAAGMAANGRPVLANGANMAFRKDTYLKSRENQPAQPWASGDDMQMLFYAKQQKVPEAIRFVQEKEALVFTPPCRDLKSMLMQRFRWVSKSKKYKDGEAVWVSLIVLIFNLVVFLTPLFWIQNRLLFAIGIGLWIMKLLADLPVMIRITDFTGQAGLMKYYFRLQLVYPLWIVIAAAGGLAGKFTWKGKKYRN